MCWFTKKFEVSRGQSNLRPMKGIRGFAVFLFFIVHYVTNATPWISKWNSHLLLLMKALHMVGNTGVDLFFVLSGYLIYGTLIVRKQQYLLFMARRIERIYPTFIVVFGIYIVLSYVYPAENKIPRNAPLSYLFQNLFLLPGLFDIEPLIKVAWSLSYEMFYYLTMPLIVVVLKLRQRRITWRILFVSLAAILTALYCAVFGGPIRLIMFMAGILLYESIQSGKVRAPSGGVALISLAVGLMTSLLPIEGYVKIAVLFAAFFIFCLHVFLRPTDQLAKILSWTPVRWFGNMSYSYYLLHGLVLKAGFLFLGIFMAEAEYGETFFWSTMPIMFMLTLSISAALFLLVERPFSIGRTAEAYKPSQRIVDAPRME